MDKKLELSLKDIYQLLISELRYGYTRNNHLMPSSAFTRVENIILEMIKVDKDFAISTLKQICEECISWQLLGNFYDGEDDENGNRKLTIDFIKWCLAVIQGYDFYQWLPYNYNDYKENIAKDNAPRYNIYLVEEENKTLISKSPLSENNYLDFIIDEVTKDSTTNDSPSYKVHTEYGSGDYIFNHQNRKKNYTYFFNTKTFYVEHI